MANETCDACNFDASDFTRSDLLGTARVLVPMLRQMTEGIDDAVLARRPDPEVWSALEYTAHSRDVTAVLGLVLDLMLTEDHPVLPPGPGPDDIGDPATPSTMAEALAELGERMTRLEKTAAALEPDGWEHQVTIGDDTVDVTWIVAHAVHDAVHHLHDIGRGVHALGAGAPTQTGTLVQINTSGGGVPKTPIVAASIGPRGVEGDRQNDRKHHGRPLQALSLWSQEVIESLQAEGHPIHAGAAGENLTLAGIDWRTIRPGVRLQIGDVLMEISAYATPCAKNAQWFADRDFTRIDHDEHPRDSRAYAWVLAGGRIATGDAVVVEP